ncbi:MAG: hypothetical protein AB8B55_10685 [Mariniblastus sp.]
MSQLSSDIGDDSFGEAMVESAEEAADFVAPPQYRKQGFSIYTVMLMLSVLFLTIATIVFFYNASSY